jgi:hypothetical protein
LPPIDLITVPTPCYENCMNNSVLLLTVTLN